MIDKIYFFNTLIIVRRKNLMRDFFHNLRFKIILIILTAIIPYFILLTYSTLKQRDLVIRNAEDELTHIAAFLSSQQDLINKTTENFLIGLAKIYNESNKDKTLCSKIFSNFIKSQEIYSNIGIALTDGTVWCSAVQVTKNVSFYDREWFQKALKTKRFVSSEYVLGKITQKPLAAYGYPVLNRNGDVTAIVFAGINLNWIKKYINNIVLPSGSIITIIDHNGKILVRTAEPEKWIGKTITDSEIYKIISVSKTKGVSIVKGIDGIKRFTLYYPFKCASEKQSWIIASIPESTLIAPANKQIYKYLILFGIFTIISIAITLFISEEFIVKRVNKLISLTKRIKDGDLDVRTEITYGKSELSNLVKTFDEMAERLRLERDNKEKALLQLHKSEQRLTHLLSVSPVIIYTLELDTFNPIWISPNINKIIGYTVKEALEPKWWLENLHPDDKEQAKERSLTIFSKDKLVHEYRFRKKDGQYIWIRDEMVLIKDKEKNLTTIIGAWTDITESKKTEEKLIQQFQILNALYSSAQKITMSINLYEIAQDISRLCVEEFGADIAWIGKKEEDGSVSFISQYPLEHPYPRQINVRWDNTPEGNGPTGRAIRSGKPVKCEYINEDPCFSPWRDLALSYGIFTTMAVPLISRGKTFGTLNLYSRKKDFFTDENIDMFQAFSNQAATALENSRLFDETNKRLSAIKALRNIDMAITSSLDPRVTLKILIEEVMEQLEVDASTVLIIDSVTHTLKYSEGKGLKIRFLENRKHHIWKGPVGKAIKEQRVIFIKDLSEIDDPLFKDLMKEEGFTLYYAVPIISKGKVLGILETYHKKRRKYNNEWIELLEALAGQAAIAIENSQLFYDLHKSNIELQQAYDETIEGWSLAMDLRDKETEGHTKRVTELTIKIARLIGMRDNEIVHVRRGALLHDIGKLGVPDGILLKPGKLTDEEMELMKKHPQLAFEMLSPIEYLRPALDIPYCHHEKWDGTGYPRGLKGKQIPLSARIFAVVDVWDALTSDRPYRPAWSKEKALNYIKEESGKSFDPEIVDVFLKLEEIA